MGIFSKKRDKAGSTTSGTSRKDSLADLNSSSQSSLKSPATPSFSTTPIFPKVAMPKNADPRVDPAGYLRSIPAVREQCKKVFDRAVQDRLNHFNVDMTKFADAAEFVVMLIKRDFSPNFSKIPPHGRLQHFNAGGRDRVEELVKVWGNAIDPSERCRRILDLVLVSVLLDAGAGNSWKYTSKQDGKVYRRSEGLAIASLEMFKEGLFSSNSHQPYQVDGEGLKRLNEKVMAHGLQVSESNPIAGLEGRTGLLTRLGDALFNQNLFGVDARPGNMLDYLIAHETTQATSVPIVILPTLWSVLMDGLAPIWPAARTVLDNTSLGDAWPLSTLPTPAGSLPYEGIVPFHKLTQWLCYSLMQPMTKFMSIHFAGAELMTGLPEYRNGGLFIDIGVLTLKPEDAARGLKTFQAEGEKSGMKVEVVPMFTPDDDVIVEWRAVTVGFLDLLLEKVNEALPEKLSLPQMLEAGSWKGGREMAEMTRPNTQCPPIAILSDGTVF